MRASFPDDESCAEALGVLGIRFDALRPEASTLAGRLWKEHCARKGVNRRRVVADFLVGAHARVQADTLTHARSRLLPCVLRRTSHKRPDRSCRVAAPKDLRDALRGYGVRPRVAGLPLARCSGAASLGTPAFRKPRRSVVPSVAPLIPLVSLVPLVPLVSLVPVLTASSRAVGLSGTPARQALHRSCRPRSEPAEGVVARAQSGTPARPGARRKALLMCLPFEQVTGS